MNVTPESFEVRDEEVYMDNAATTVIDPEVVAAMQPFLEEKYGNPETAYHLGREALEAVEKAQDQVSELLGCLPEEVYFTSGGTEANNWAVKGFNMTGKSTIVSSPVEHLSILEPLKWLAKCFPEAYTYALLGVDGSGIVDMAELKKEVENGDVGLVSIQYANNETGTLQPIKEIAKLCSEHKVVFHTDAVQAIGKVEVDVDMDGFDMATISSHKIHGPVGVGALYIRPGIDIEPLIHGGSHQNGMRAGTIPVHQIVGFGKAAELAYANLEKVKSMGVTLDRTADDLKLRLNAVINGSPENHLPTILSVTIPDVEAALLCGILESKYGICVSVGSACCTSSKEPSHVLKSMGVEKKHLNSTIRISLSSQNTQKQIGILSSAIEGAVSDAKRERDVL